MKGSNTKNDLEHQSTPEKAKKRIQLTTLFSPAQLKETKENPLKGSNSKSELDHQPAPEKAKKRIPLITLSSPAVKKS